MSNASDFHIAKNGVLRKYNGPSGDVTIPDSVISIDNWGLFDLKKLKTVTIPESVTSIGYGAFSECPNLKSITILGSTMSFGNDLLKNSGEPLIFAPKLPLASLKTAKLLFNAACGFLAKPELYLDPDIAAEYRKYISGQKKKLLPFVFEKDLVSGLVEYGAAESITKKNFESDFLAPAQELKAKQCVAWLLAWGDQHLKPSDVGKEMAKELAKPSLSVGEIKKLWAYEKRMDGSIEITGYKGDEKQVLVPDKIGQDFVTAIADEAFSPEKARRTKVQGEILRTIETVELPAGIKSIGARAFAGCKKLKKINIPLNASIGECAFLECKKLADASGFVIYNGRVFGYNGSGGNIAVPEGVVSIEPFAFSKNKKTIAVSLPQSVEAIGNNAFEKCYELQAINIPAKVTVVETEAFRWCKNLKEVRFEGALTSIKENAFNHCEILQDIVLPESLINIAAQAFADCGELRHIGQLGDVAINHNAFCGCKKLADDAGFVAVGGILFDYVGNGGDVVIPSGVKVIGYNAFLDCEDLRSVTIPQSVTTIYKSSFNGWETDVYAGWKRSADRKPVIHAPAGSYAETYAKENNIPFVAE